MEQDIQVFLQNNYNLPVVRVAAITNEMFRCETDSTVYFARVTIYKSREEQEEEVAYTDFLSKNGLSVSATIPSQSGEHVETLSVGNKKMWFVLYHAAPGRHATAEEWNADLFYELGKQIGKLHRSSKQFEEQHPTPHIKEWYENEEYQFLKYIPEEETKIREKAAALLTKIRSIPKSRDTYGLLHGDIWLENVLVEGKRLSLVDFQDCEKNYYLYDLAVPIYSAVEYTFTGNGNIVDYQKDITRAILAGYETEHELPDEMLVYFPLFLKLKELFEYSLMHQYGDKSNRSEEEVRILNHFRMRLERDTPVLLF